MARIGSRAAIGMLAVLGALGAVPPAGATSYLYVIGGIWATAVNSVWYAQVQPGGTIGPWTSTSGYPITIHSHDALGSGNSIYVFSGCLSGGCGGITSAVYSAQASPAGPLSGWTSTSPVPTPYTDPVVIADAAGSHAYLMGGLFAGTARDRVWTAGISGGAVAPWATRTPLPSPMANHAGCEANGFAFLYHHSTVWTGWVTGVWSAPIGGGLIGPWTTQPLPQQTPLRCHTLSSCGGHLYVIGGQSSPSMQTSSAYHGTTSGGTVTGWSSTTALPVSVVSHSAAIADGYVFVAGGDNVSGASVHSAPILGTGALGAWTSLNPMPTPLIHHKMIAVCFDSQGTPVTCGCAPSPVTGSPTATATPTGGPPASWTATPTPTASQSDTATRSSTPSPTLSATWTGTVGATAPPSWTATVSSAAPAVTQTPASGLLFPPPFVVVGRNFFSPPDPLAILFAVTQDGPLALKIFDSAGEFVAEVWSRPARGFQLHEATWDGRNYAGAQVASGAYIVRLVSAEVTLSAKVAFLR